MQACRDKIRPEIIPLDFEADQGIPGRAESTEEARDVAAVHSVRSADGACTTCGTTSGARTTCGSAASAARQARRSWRACFSSERLGPSARSFDRCRGPRSPIWIDVASKTTSGGSGSRKRRRPRAHEAVGRMEGGGRRRRGRGKRTSRFRTGGLWSTCVLLEQEWLAIRGTPNGRVSLLVNTEFLDDSVHRVAAGDRRRVAALRQSSQPPESRPSDEWRRETTAWARNEDETNWRSLVDLREQDGGAERRMGLASRQHGVPRRQRPAAGDGRGSAALRQSSQPVPAPGQDRCGGLFRAGEGLRCQGASHVAGADRPSEGR